MKNIKLFIILYLFAVSVNAQLLRYRPINAHELLINNEGIENINVYHTDEDRNSKKLQSTHFIDRFEQEITSENYILQSEKLKSRCVLKYNEDWIVESSECRDSLGKLLTSEVFQYDNGLLLSKKEIFSVSLDTNRDGRFEWINSKVEYIYIYGTAHESPLSVTCYKGWEQKEILYEKQFEYDFDDQNRIVSKSIKKSDLDSHEFMPIEEYSWDYLKNETRCEHHIFTTGKTAFLKERFRDGSLIKALYRGDREVKQFEMEYDQNGLIQTLEISSNYSGQKLRNYILYEYR